MVKKITIYRALIPFLSEPHEKLHLAHIARSIKQPHPTVRLWLNIFEKQGILTKQTKGRLSLFSLNWLHPLTTDYAVIGEKTKLIEKCRKDLALAEIVQSVRSFSEENTKALIFGSTATSAKADDVDLLMIGRAKIDEIKKVARRFSKKLHIIDVRSLTKISFALKQEITKKHLLIRGSEELIGWMYGNNHMVQETGERYSSHTSKSGSFPRVHSHSRRNT